MTCRPRLNAKSVEPTRPPARNEDQPPSNTEGQVPKTTGANKGAGCPLPPYLCQELALSTVTARRFCDQHEMSLQTATGRSLPYEIVRMRCACTPRDTR
jgi:hypothetical protein